MKQNWSIPVTQFHIENAVPNDPRRCMIFMALRDKLPISEIGEIIVKDGKAKLQKLDENGIPIEYWIYELSDHVALAVVALDRQLRDDIRPFHFRLSDPKIKKIIKRPNRGVKGGPGATGSIASALGRQRSAEQYQNTRRIRAKLKKEYGPHKRLFGMGV